MNECKQLTKARNFEENLVMLIEDMNTGHDDYITMAEFVAFYLYESSQLRKIVKKLSKEINKKGSDDIAYIRKWKTIFHRDQEFTKADLELLFEEVIEVALTSSELELIWNNLIQGKKKATSIKAGSVQRFFKTVWEQTFTGLNKTMKCQFMIYKLVQTVTIMIGWKRQVIYHLVVNV